MTHSSRAHDNAHLATPPYLANVREDLMEDRFDSAFRKIKRALKHIDDLEAEVDIFWTFRPVSDRQNTVCGQH
jgi:hypothetical protein